MVHRIVVEDQSLRWYGRPPEIADNSIEFVQFQFHLPEEWASLLIVAQFTQSETYNMLITEDVCFLPVELKAGICQVSLFGYSEGKPVRATSIPLVFQIKESGFVSSAETPIPPTPDLYAQLIEYFSSIAGSGGGGSGSGTINPEDIAAAVEDYLSKNPPEIPGIPTITANRYSDEINGTGVMVTTTNYDADGSITVNNVLVNDGKNGVSPQLKLVKVETIGADETPSGAISGPYNQLTLSLKIPKGADGEDGQDYVLTEDDKAKIAEMAAELVDVPDSGGNPDYVGVEPAEDDMPKVFLTGVKPTTKDEVLAEMEYVSKTDRFHAYLTIKCQGTSSMSYAKKNFTIKMFSDEARETKLKKSFRDWNHNGNKYVLKANYIDHSHARNIVSARLWNEIVRSRPDYESLPEEMRNSPRNGAVDGFPIKVYYNGSYEGIYTWNIGKEDWQWGMDEDNPNHVLLCAETNNNGSLINTPCNFRKLWNGVNEQDWSVEVGTNSTAVKTALNNLIQFVMDNDDDAFRNGIGNYLDIQSAIDYYIFQYEVCGLDGLAKNMLLATYDGVLWRCGAYDLDSTFGLFWNGSKFVAATYKCPEDYQETYSLLWERIEANYANELKTRQAELRKSVLSYANIVTHFERFMDIIGLDLYAEDLTIYTGIPSGSTNNIKQIRNYIRDRQAYVDAEFAAMSAPVPCEGITLDKTSLAFTGEGTQTITATVVPDGCTDSIVWVSSNPAIVIISVEGNICTVEAIANGNATITATCGEFSASCSVAVSGMTEVIPCTGITLDKTELSFTADGSQTIVATVTPADTTDKIVWSSDAPGVAKVEDGVVTAVANGTATITATCGNYSASCSVEVSGVAAAMLYSLPEAKTFNGISDYIDTGIKLFDTPKDFTIILSADMTKCTGQYYPVFHCINEASPYPGLCLQYNGSSGWDIGGNTGDKSMFVADLSPSTKAVAIVVEQGVVTGAKYLTDIGTVVTPELITPRAYVTVNQNLLLGCYQTTKGDKGRYFNGDIYVFDVYGEALDEAVIVDKLYGVTKIVPCTGITLDKTEIAFTEAGSQTLIAIVEPNNCNVPIVWNTSNKYIAAVDNGVVTAVSDGSATITATCGVYSASCEVTVSGVGKTLAYTARNIDVSTANVDTGVCLTESDIDFTIIYKAKLTGTIGGGDYVFSNGMVSVWLRNGVRVRTAYGGVGPADCVVTYAVGDTISIFSTHESGGSMHTYVFKYGSDGTFERYEADVVGTFAASSDTLQIRSNGIAPTVDEFSVYPNAMSGVEILEMIGSRVVTVDDVIWSETAEYSINTGEVVSGKANYITPDAIEIPDGAFSIWLKNVNDSTFTYQGIAQYDADMTFIKYGEGNTTTTALQIAAAEGAKYVRFSAYPNNVATNIPATGLAAEFWMLIE